MKRKINLEGLDQLQKAIKDAPNIRIRVGVLGEHVARKGGSSNAEIGAVHEYGAPKRNIPARSFLRMPIGTKLKSEMNKAGLFTKDAEAEVVRQGSIKPWADKIGNLCVAIVAQAFATQGFGSWEPWRNPKYTNNTGQLLQDSTQLRDSISFEVKE